MKTTMHPRISFLALFVALFTYGCANNTSSSQPITTTTLTGTSTAPAATEVAERNNALMRFIHAVPATASTDLFAGDLKAFASIAYKSVTPYSEVPASKNTFRLRLAGQDSAQPLVEEVESLSKGTYYTAVALPSAGTAIIARNDGTDLLFLVDKFVAPSAGKAKLRVVHAVPDLGELDVYLAGRSEAVLKGIGFGSAGDYAELEPSTASLEVRRAGENVTTLSVPQTNLAADKLYTVLIVGRTKGTANLEAVIIEDQLGAASAK